MCTHAAQNAGGNCAVLAFATVIAPSGGDITAPTH